MSDEVLILAYDAGKAALQQQDATLTNLRNRAAGLLGATSFGSSVAAGVGLLNTDRSKGAAFPAWGGWPLLASVVVIGASVIFVSWPTRWSFGLQGDVLAERAGRDIDEVRSAAVKAMTKAIGSNSVILARRMLWFRVGATTLVTQLAFLIVVLIAAGT